MKKRNFLLKIVAVFLFFYMPLQVRAIIAYPYPVQVKQADGSYLNVRLHGDEYFHYTVTEGGDLVAFKDGFYYYADYSFSGQLRLSNVRVGNSGALLSAKQRTSIPDAVIKRVLQQKQHTGAQMKSTFPSTGKIRSLVLLVNFSDVKFSVSSANSAFEALLNQAGYSVNGATGSARDYYRENSANRFDPEFVVVGPLELERPMSYYGKNDEYGNDSNPRQMVIDACQKAMEAGVNFADYDLNGDGDIDNVFIYYAGYNEAEGADANTVWPHRSYVKPGTYFNGVQLRDYACSSEYKGNSGTVMAGIGNFCHEFGHVLGWPDFYDTDATVGGYYEGVYNWSLMCAGSYNNESRTPPCLTALEKWMAGWLKPEVITVSREYALSSIDKNQAYVLQTKNEGEFFILENRQQTSWDLYLDGRGMLIYHVDRSRNMVGGYPASMRWELNSVNNVAAHPCMDLISARPSNGSGNINMADIPFPGRSGATEFSNTSNPSNRTWAQGPITQNVVNIREEGETIRFEVRGSHSGVLKGKVTTTYGKPLQAASVCLKRIKEKSAGEKIRALNVDPAAADINVYTDGSGMYEIKEPLELGTYEIVVQKEGYMDYARTISIIPDENILNIELRGVEEENFKELAWSNGKYNTAVGASGTSFKVAAAWEAADLDNYVGYKLNQVKVFIKDPADVELLIYIGEDTKPVVRKPFTPRIGTFTVVDISQENVSIPAGKALKIGYEVKNYEQTGHPAGVDGGLTRPGKGNLISKGDQWELLSEAAGIEGNWLISAYVLPGDAIPVTGIKVEPEQLELAIGEDFVLKGQVLPENATNRFIQWVSADEKIAKVDKTGKVTGVNEGETFITAVSEEGGFKAPCKVRVVLKQQVTGKVVDTQGKPVEGVQLTFVKTEENTLQSTDIKGIMLMNITRSGEKYSGTTDAKGEYLIKDIPEGKYEITLFKEGYEKSEHHRQLYKGLNSQDFVLETPEEAHSVKLSWSQGDYEQMVGAKGQEMIAAIKFDRNDLADYVGYRLNQVRFLITCPAQVEVNIYIIGENFVDDLVPAYKKKVKPAIGEYTVVDLKEFNIVIPPDKDIKIGYVINGYDKNVSPAAVDGSPAEDGKGNLILFTADYVWSTLTEEIGIGGNWLITAYLLEDENRIPVADVYLDQKEITLAVRESLKLNATVLPENATNKGVIWTSSHPAIAMVSADGVVRGVAEGETVITATTRDGKKTATCRVGITAARKGSVSGTVVSAENGPIKNAKVTFRDLETAGQKVKTSGKTFALKSVRTSGNSTEIITDEEGRFSVPELFASRYEIVVTADQYNTYTKTIEIKEGENRLEPIVLSRDSRADAVKLKWHTGEFFNSIGGQGAEFIAAAFWSEEDLKAYWGYHLDYMDIFLQSSAKVEILVYLGESREPVVSKIINPEPGTFTTIDLREYHLVIQAHKSLLLGYKLLEYDETDFPAAVDETPTMEGKGNLMCVGDKWGHISDFVENFKGNWLITGYLYKAEPIPVEKILITSASDTLGVGDTLRFNAQIVPGNATNPYFQWQSSDESVVGITAEGLARAYKEGKVEIRAVAEEGGISASKPLCVVKKQLIRGKVRNTFGEAIEKARVIFTSQAGTQNAIKTNLFIMSTLTAEQGKTYSGVTDAEGNYQIENIPPALYKLSIEKEGYVTYNLSVKVEEGINVQDAEIVSTEIARSSALKWHDGVYKSAVGAGGSPFIAVASWTAEELQEYVGYKLVQTEIFIQEAAEIEVVAFLGESMEPVFRKAIQPELGRFTKVDLTEENLYVPEDEDLKVGYHVLKYNKVIYPAGLDAGPALDGKGNVVGIGGKWSTLLEVSGNELQGNWLITAYLSAVRELAVKVIPAQRDAWVSWENSEAEYWTIEWRKKGEEEFTKEIVKKNAFQILDLIPDTEYELKVTESDGISKKLFFKTLALTSKYAALALRYTYGPEEPILLQATNLPEAADQLMWKIDGQLTEDKEIILPAGEHEIVLEFVHNGETEIISRYIKVESSK